MYLGVHTPIDVVASLLIALAFIFVLRPVFATEEGFKKYMPITVVVSVILSFSFLCYVLIISSDSTLDPHNYESGLKNACTLIGCTAGLIPVYLIDTKYTDFKTDACWYAQIIKLLGGLIGVLAIKSGLKTPLIWVCGNELVARAIRYFLIVVFAGAVWPLTFKWFSNLKIEFMEKFTARISEIFSKKMNRAD
jgi:undecaprenyl-diphosphatase